MEKKEPEVSSFEDLNSQEKYIIEMIRYIGFGEIRATIQNGVLLRIDEYKRSIKL